MFKDKAALESGLLESARVIASKSPVGIYTIKKVIRHSNKDYYSRLDYVLKMNSVMLQSQDNVEAITAFLEKRKPNFSKL